MPASGRWADGSYFGAVWQWQEHLAQNRGWFGAGRFGRGIAGRLCADIEQEAQRRGVRCLRTDASVLSRPVFAQRGYVLVKQERVEKEAIEFIRFIMEKTLCE